MVKGTVALPVFNSAGIAWLCMESLCRQNNPTYGWELIVFEEMHLTMLGEAFFRGYEARLYAAGCENLTYLTDDHWIPLSHKWVLIAQAAAPTSEYYCLCAADNYYQPDMLRDAEKKEGDWNITTKGYFYNFLTDQVVLYSFQSKPIGLQMIASTERVREFPLEVKKVGVDTWFAKQMGPKKNVINDNHWQKILCTHGMNNISQARGTMIENVEDPFYYTLTNLIDIVPGDICVRLWNLSRKIRECLT